VIIYKNNKIVFFYIVNKYINKFFKKYFIFCELLNYKSWKLINYLITYYITTLKNYLYVSQTLILSLIRLSTITYIQLKIPHYYK
jgi:hypothetical protein